MQNGPISRSDLTERVGMTQASVINITKELIQQGLLIEVGYAAITNQGRKPIMLDVPESAFYCIGAALSVDKLECGIEDAKGNIVDMIQFSLDRPDELTGEMLTRDVTRMVEQLLNKTGISREQVLGVGFASPGPLDTSRGIMVDLPNYRKLKNVPIVKMLEVALQMPVVLDKETNMAALAETYYGEGRKYKTIFFLSLFSLGVGGSLVSDKNIFHGFADGAGEIGHITIDPSGVKCACGNYGCLEALISEDYTLNQAKKFYKLGANETELEDVDDLTIEDVFRRATQQEKVCSGVIDQMCAYISIAVRNIINIYSPELIVLGGEIPRQYPQVVDAIRERIYRQNYPAYSKDVKIEITSLGELVYLRGAMVAVRQKFMRVN